MHHPICFTNSIRDESFNFLVTKKLNIVVNWLEIFIPFFVVTFSLIYFAWNCKRRKKLSNNITLKIFSEIEISDLFKEDKLTLTFLFLGTLVGVIYGVHPPAYKILLPIEILDRPFINYSGLFILKLSLMLLFIINIQCDLNILNKIQGGNLDPFASRVNKLLTISVTFMLIGLFITISSIGTLLIAIFASFHAKTVLSKGQLL